MASNRLLQTVPSNTSPQTHTRPNFWRSLGPGIITAAVVIGPGSITVASKIGAAAGLRLLWILLVAGSFMMLFTVMAARIGVLNKDSLLSLTARHYGRWLAVLVGLLSFVVVTSFQMSNYLACGTALRTLTGRGESLWIWLVGAVSLIFVHAARQLYRVVEKIMMSLVLIMLLAFLANLVVARPNLPDLAQGILPGAWPLELTGLVTALIATTFSVIAALYQSTLAQQKGWQSDDLKLASREALFGIAVLLAVTLMIMTTAATVLRGKSIASAADLAEQLGPLLGPTATVLFALGFFAAAFSSTILNAMIGGGLLADSLGYSSNIDGWPCRLGTTLAMIVGLTCSAYTLTTGSPIEGIVLAQKTTILAVPLCAFVLILLANHPQVVGPQRNSKLTNLWALTAFLVLLTLSGYRLYEIILR